MNHLHNPSKSKKTFSSAFVHARKEAVLILWAWLVCMIWTVGYAAFAGYGDPGAVSAELVWGIPAWVFWGVLIPWLSATVFSICFALFYMTDDTSGITDVEAE